MATGPITDKQVLDAVERYVYHRHRHLTRSNIMGFSDEDHERLKVDKNGYLVFTVEGLQIEETEKEDDTTIWYVSATLYFQVEEGEEIEGSEDVYEAYQCQDETTGKLVWCVDWHSS